MEEGERREVNDLVLQEHNIDQVQGEHSNRLSGFADQLATCLLKETISEAGGVDEGGDQIWSIPCSRECRSHKHERGQYHVSMV